MKQIKKMKNTKMKNTKIVSLFFTFVNVPIPSAVIARAAKNLNCKSGEAKFSFVLKNPPWSHPVEVSGPDLFIIQSNTTLGLFKVVPGILITEVTERPSFPFEHS